MIDISKLRERLKEHYTEIRGPVLANALTEAHMAGFYDGREHGQAEAQRGVQLMLGIAVPTNKEAALWSYPMPARAQE